MNLQNLPERHQARSLGGLQNTESVASPSCVAWRSPDSELGTIADDGLALLLAEQNEADAGTNKTLNGFHQRAQEQTERDRAAMQDVLQTIEEEKKKGNEAGSSQHQERTGSLRR